MKVEFMNKKEGFGKAMLEMSDCTNKKKVGLLKIIRLPSDRSIPETIQIQNSMHLSIRGSIKTPNDLEIGTPKYLASKEYKIFTAKHSLNNLRFSPALTPSGRFGLRSNKNSRKHLYSPFGLSEVKEKKPSKKSKPPVSKKMESDQSASSSQSSDESSDESSGEKKHVVSAISLKEVAPAEVKEPEAQIVVPSNPKRTRHTRNSGLPNRISNLSIQTTELMNQNNEK